MDALTVRRLARDEEDAALQTLQLMVDVFDEGGSGLHREYVQRLLADVNVWLYAAFAGSVPVGGFSAHVVPMTRSMSSELFIYDIAVRADLQRQGIGRLLVDAARLDAARAGLESVWVLAEVEDEHAVAFYRRQGAEPTEAIMFTWTGSPASSSDPS